MTIEIPNELYPVVVIQDRYGGVYSKGEWLAISEADRRDDQRYARAMEMLEGGPSGSDTDAMAFWMSPPDWIAVGPTPDEAVRKLVEKRLS
jgi:hypothetical protein